MKNILIRLGKIDRRIIFLLIGLSVLIPLIKPEWVKLPIKIDNNTKVVYDSISSLNEGDKVLLSFEYGASTKPEVHPMAVALLKHLFSKGIKVYIVSLVHISLYKKQILRTVLRVSSQHNRFASRQVHLRSKRHTSVIVLILARVDSRAHRLATRPRGASLKPPPRTGRPRFARVVART